MPSSPHPYRSAAHQLQHPEHASYSPSPRSTPLYSSAARSSHIYRTTSNASSPEAFSEHDSPRRGAHEFQGGPSSRTASTSRASAYDAGQQPGSSASKRRKQSHDSSVIPDVSGSPSNAGHNASAEAHLEPPGSDSRASSRVAKACQPCSTKKRRCDGRQPECSVCQVLGTPCTYNHTGLKRGPPKGFRSGPKESARAKLIRTLETTIRDLVNHLGKEDAGAEIVRVSGERSLPISEAQNGEVDQKNALKSRRDDVDNQVSSRIKIENLTSNDTNNRFIPSRGSDGEDGDPAEEDVIGETRQGELVYRGSSSGIGILQRQHRAESPSGALALAASRSVGSSSSAPFGGRTRDDRHSGDASLHSKAPIFLPISSPRPHGDAETASSQDRSPRVNRNAARKEATHLQSLYPGSSHDSRAAASHVSAEDPIVSDEENDRLFRYYWQGFHPFYPILYKPWFVGFSREDLRSNLEPSLLFAIYAIGACVVPGNASHSSASEPESSIHKLNLERAQLFCQTAERHVLAKGLRPDIASIQTCWLLSLYSHGTGDLSRAWNFQNLASSMAVDMGLHRWPIYRPEIVQDRVQRETRIRIIWHCYIVDKLLCAEMGRPVGLRAKDIDVPLLSETEDDEFELWSDQTEMQPVGQAGGRSTTSTSASLRRLHAPSCLNWGVHLFKIVESILHEVHSLRRKAFLRKQGKQQVLADLDRQLTEWKEKLPAHLHLDDSTNDGPFPSFFALNLWYYTGRLLLHRPFIPQEEGLAMSKVLENDSHRQSTLAANTICDLLEAASRDIVDRLSTDLGYCLFTAAVMFVFNARLPDPKIAADARRRYGLCVQWLKKLADTWPAASAHRLLLDGFAVVGEDASKQGVDAQRRRPSIAVLNSANAGLGMASASKVSNWIAETEGALQEPSPNQAASSSSDRATRQQPGSRGELTPQMLLQPNTRLPDTPALANNWNNGNSNSSATNDPTYNDHMRSVSAQNLMDFAPGIFDVESFFWNENAAAPALMMNFNQVPSTSAPHQQGLSAQAMPYAGFNGGILGGIGNGAGGFQMGGGMQNAPPAIPYPVGGGGMGYGQQRASAVPGSQPVQTPARPSEGSVSQSNPNVAAGAEAAAAGGASFNTSPFAFNPTSQSLGEFWSMLELPPAFLQQ